MKQASNKQPKHLSSATSTRTDREYPGVVITRNRMVCGACRAPLRFVSKSGSQIMLRCPDHYKVGVRLIADEHGVCLEIAIGSDEVESIQLSDFLKREDS